MRSANVATLRASADGTYIASTASSAAPSLRLVDRLKARGLCSDDLRRLEAEMAGLRDDAHLDDRYSLAWAWWEETTRLARTQGLL